MRELSAAWTPDWHARYDSLQEKAITLAQGANERGLDAADAAQVIVEAITAQNPQTRYLIGDAVAMAPTVHDSSDQQLDEMFAGIFG